MGSKPNLLTLACGKFKCPPDAYEQTMLRRSVSPLVWPVVCFLLRVQRESYEFDLELIEEMKNATTFEEVSQIISDYCSMPRQHRALKLIFKARISKRRLKSLAREVFNTAA